MKEINQEAELAIMCETARAMIRHRNIHTLLNEVLEVLDREMYAKRATLTLYQEEHNALVIETSKGLTSAERSRGRYKIGEGITGSVAENKESVMIVDISQEPGFLDRTKARRNERVAFICVPVLHLDKLVGTISVDLENNAKKHLETCLDLITKIAALVAESVVRIRLVEQEKQQMAVDNARLRRDLSNKFNPSNIIGTSRAIVKACEQINEYGDLHEPVFICGEEGVGKELTARSIHYNSIRQQNPFNLLNCIGIPPAYIERELFGLEGDGQIINHGLLDQSHGGTLYIEELSCFPIELQMKLDEYIRTQSFTRVGGVDAQMRNVRIVIASQEDPQNLLMENKIVTNLYAIFNNYIIMVPPLRERKGDVVQLADYFLDELCQSYGKNVQRISTPAINMLTAYHYPGNVLELRNCIERAVLSTTDSVIHGYNLPPSLQIVSQGTTSAQGDTDFSQVTDLNQALMTYERELLIEALKKHRGNAAAVARALNASPRVLNYRFSKLGINLKEFKKSSSGRISH